MGIGQAVANEKFSYVNSQTPTLYNIFPSVSYGGEETLLYLSGIHRISYLGADKDLGNFSFYFKGTFMAFILVRVYVLDLGFSKMLSIQTQINLFNASNLLYNRLESIMYLNIFILVDH